MNRIKRLPIILALIGLGLLGGAGGALFVYSGIFNPSATLQHTGPVYWLLDVTLRQSVRRRAADIQVPPLADRALTERGFRLFRAHCEQCHGAPGVAHEPFALGMIALPANLTLTAREWGPAELYWVIKNGVRMTGMPAWEFRLVDADLWAVVAFLQLLPTLDPQDYRKMARTLGNLDTAMTAPAADPPPGPGDARRGKTALQQYACVSCHEIPGIVGANNPVGPPLDGIARRKYLAGILPNTWDNMIYWLRSPQTVDAQTAMPNLGVSEIDARDMAAYLYGLE
jgi:mono/diheme cytochrome c family protein